MVIKSLKRPVFFESMPTKANRPTRCGTVVNQKVFFHCFGS